MPTPMTHNLEFGLDTFGAVIAAPNGKLVPHAWAIRNAIDEAILADRLGIDFFGIGEHHRSDFAVSAPEVVLTAIAGRTSRIRLGRHGPKFGLTCSHICIRSGVESCPMWAAT